ncbi:hypothetical protein RRG08_049437 [Elysia crispata]|uniref:Uncharacterized protein n=1 Tax=Elysia crispata TaxID=231223 RepID=A0AAE0ZT12_9GAST|nr:hypothetical protein RRG08_049437 [Elysia crispata]
MFVKTPDGKLNRWAEQVGPTSSSPLILTASLEQWDLAQVAVPYPALTTGAQQSPGRSTSRQCCLGKSGFALPSEPAA